MIDVCARARDLIAAAGHSPAYLRKLDSTTAREGVVVRPLPSYVSSADYGRGTHVGYLYQVIVRRRDPGTHGSAEERAAAECGEIASLLDGADMPSANGSYALVGQHVDSPPQELADDEQGFWAWQVRMRADIYIV